MSLLVVVLGLVLVALPSLTHRHLGQLHPVQGGRAAALSLRVGLALIQLGLLATAAPTVLGTAGATEAADACADIAGSDLPGGSWTAAAAMAALGWVWFGRRRARSHVRAVASRTRIEPWLGIHEVRDGVDHVTIPATDAVAYAVSGPAPQIVVSQGLRDQLTVHEVDAVIRHEASHLRRRHHRPLTLACEVETVFAPIRLLRHSGNVLRLAVERTADEDAAGPQDSRREVRSALAKTATSLVAAVAAFTTADTIVARLDALGHPPVDPHRARAALLVASPVMTAATAAVAWTLASHHVFLGLLSFCFD